MPDPNEPRTPKVDALEKALSVFTLEQFVMVVDVLCRIQARAIERDRDQSVEILFTRKGYPSVCKGSDDVTMPKGYTPE